MTKQKKREKKNNSVPEYIPIFYFGTSTVYQYVSQITGNNYVWKKDKSGLVPMVLVDKRDIENIKNIKGKAENPDRERKNYLFG